MAPTNESPSSSRITFQSLAELGTSLMTRLTVPNAVAKNSDDSGISSAISASGISPLARVMNSLRAPPPATDRGAPIASAGKPITDCRITRPKLVTIPTSPRAVVLTIDLIVSWLVRFLPKSSGVPSVVRASNPVADISTKQGSSLTSSETGRVAETISPSANKVERRSSPNLFATSVNSCPTTFRRRLSFSRISVKSEIMFRNSSCSFSSSRRENLVSRRSGISKM